MKINVVKIEMAKCGKRRNKREKFNCTLFEILINFFWLRLSLFSKNQNLMTVNFVFHLLCYFLNKAEEKGQSKLKQRKIAIFEQYFGDDEMLNHKTIT